MAQPIVVGCGAGFSADRLDPACALAQSGRIACLVLECLGERTPAIGPGESKTRASGTPKTRPGRCPVSGPF